ncbi:MAG: M12 family metallopeptidase [Dysgonomonas sp.]|nr:M12 family metallopeptidase [Dysgonomonas sp.]
MKKISFLILVAILAFWSCSQEDLSDDATTLRTTNEEGLPHFEGVEKEIMLWGSKAWVLDTGDKYIFQGDIILDKAEIDAENAAPSTRAAVVNDRKWPYAAVYYTYNNLSNQQKTWVFEAMQRISSVTPVSFIYRQWNQRDYIEFISNGDLGYSHSNYIGYKGGKQIIGISNGAGIGSSIHEIGHALGLFHEQSRADRDQHLIIDWSRIDDPHQYRTYVERGESGYDLGAFDYGSIMLYSSRKINGGYDMVRRDNLQPIQAQNFNLSAGDIQAIRDKYREHVVIEHVSTTRDRMTFRVQHMPQGATIQWTAVNNATLMSGQGTSTATFSYRGGEVKVKAVVTYKGRTRTMESSEWAGALPNLPNLQFTNIDLGQNILYYDQSMTLSITGGDSEAGKQNVSEYRWYLGSWSNYVEYISEYPLKGSTIYVKVPAGAPNYEYIMVSPVNEYGEGTGVIQGFSMVYY